MPKRLSRLKSRAEFLRIAGARRKYAVKALVLQVAQQAPGLPDGARVGYTASRKVGGAVIRNRAKRRLRAAVAEILTARALPDHDYVLIARQETATVPWPELLRDLENACRRVKAWRNEP